MRRLLLSLAPIALLSACGTPYVAADVKPRDFVASQMGGSDYGMFLAGKGALNDGASAEAAAYFSQLQGAEGAESLVQERAFTAALLSGDVPAAVELIPQGEEVGEPTRRLAALTRAVDLMAQGKGALAKDALATDIGFPHRAATALLSPWASAMAGDDEGALVRPQVRGDKSVDYMGQLGQAILFERAKRFDEAETDYKALALMEEPISVAVLAYGGFLERRGRRDEAVKLYDSALQRDRSSAIEDARARAAARKSAPKLMTLREGAAQALMAPAAALLSMKQDQLGLAYLRLALRLDAQRNDAWLLVGDILEGAGDAEGARLAYAKPKAGSPEYPAAQAKLIWSFHNAGDKARALEMARAQAASGDTDALVNLADLLRANEHFAESAEILTRVIAKSPSPDWRLYYARGVALERADRWEEAEKDLQAALTARPDDPELLNYLGYSWVNRGERLPEALSMIQKAVAANPRSGAMIDSLGWAYYRLGDYKKAVERLEQAVELEAGDPEINNHLGDAYWKVGRRDEAQFQWRRVLTLEPDPKIKIEVEQKLAQGLGADGRPAAAPRVANQ